MGRNQRIRHPGQPDRCRTHGSVPVKRLWLYVITLTVIGYALWYAFAAKGHH